MIINIRENKSNHKEKPLQIRMIKVKKKTTLIISSIHDSMNSQSSLMLVGMQSATIILENSWEFL